MNDIVAKPLATRRTTAGSNTTPTANKQRKVVPVKDRQKAGEVTEKHVALLPVRYAVAPRTNEKPYRYSAATLKQDLPVLKKACYVLRSLRRGLVYVYVDNQLLGLEVTTSGNLRALASNPKGIELLIEGAALLVPSRYGKVEIAFSEHEWTEKQRKRVIANTDNARTSLMQPFSLANPTSNAIPLAQLGNEVEEFAGRANEYAWSDLQGAARKTEPYASLKVLAEDGQYVVALADPIGISHDLAALSERALADIKQFISDPDATDSNATPEKTDSTKVPEKTKQAAPVLVQPSAPDPATQAASARYRKKLVAETIGRLYLRHLKPGADPDQLAKLRQEHWRKDPAHKGKPEPSLAELRRDVETSPSVTPGAERLIKHVNEKARRDFLRAFDDELKQLRQVLEGRRADRKVWLDTWNRPGQPHALHSAWHSFDLDDRTDWQCFELSCARSIAGLGMQDCAAGNPDSPGGSMQAAELELIGQWLQASLEDSPIYRSLVGHPPLRAAAEKIAGSPVAHAPDRAGATADGVRAVIEEVYKLFPYTFGTEEIVRSMSVYVLNKPGKWRGASAVAVDEFIARQVNSGDIAAALRSLMGRYGQYVTAREVPPGTYQRYFVDAAGNPPKTLDSLNTSGQLSTDKRVIFEVEESASTRHPIVGKGQPNPFRGWGTAGISAFVGLLYLVNLKMAVASFDMDERFESSTNLLSATAAIGSGINASLMAFEVATPRALSRLYSRVPLARFLGSAFALRLFGYGGAFLTGATLGIHGVKLASKGDTDAGLWYASSALAAVAGGSALTYASGALVAGTTTLMLTPVGWLIVGAVVVGGSIYLSMSGDDAVDTPLEQWLDACTFGKQALPDARPFASFAKEMDALGAALYAPLKIDSDWSRRVGFPHYLAKATVFLPAFELGKSRLTILADGISVAPVKDRYENGGRIVEIEHYVRKELGIEKAQFVINYQPSDAFKAPYSLSFSVPE